MSSGEHLDAFERAEIEIPPKWYENSRKFGVAAVGSTVAGLGLAYAEVRLGVALGLSERQAFAFQLSGFVATTAATVADSRSTCEVFDVINEAEAKGIKIGYYEANPLAANLKTSEEFRRSKHTRFIEAASILGGVMLVTAVPVTFTKYAASLNNRRKARRVRRVIELNEA